MTLTLIYFAALRDLTGIAQENIEVSLGTKVHQLAELVLMRHPAMHLEGVRVAVNEEFSDDSHCLNEGDIVAFIPPVSGG